MSLPRASRFLVVSKNVTESETEKSRDVNVSVLNHSYTWSICARGNASKGLFYPVGVFPWLVLGATGPVMINPRERVRAARDLSK